MIYDAFMCPDFLAVANGFVSNEIPCVGVSSTARITSPTISPGQRPNLNFSHC